MLLASAPRPIRARQLGVAALALIAALATATAGRAQDGTVYIGGGENGPGGARGVQGGDNVIVNMDAIDGGRGRAGRSGTGGGGGDRSSAAFGEPYRGPAGATLLFPPKRPPESHLTIDRDAAPTARQARRAPQAGEPTPARKPERRRQPDRRDGPGREPSATSDGKPPASEDTPTTTQTAGVPEAPDLSDGGTQPDADGGAEPRTAATRNSDAAAPTALTARPDRKPEPPAQSRTAARPAPADDTATAETDTADAPAGTSDGVAAAAGDGQADAARPDVPEAPGDGETRTAATTPAEPDGGTAKAGAADAADGEAAEPGTQGETQTAALPPEGLPEQMRLMFGDDSATLSDGAKQQLDQLARVLQDNPRQRVQLMAFAEGTEDTASQARRLSLSRALAVRTYLIDKGIRSTRMDVRALGSTADQGPLDRVDIVPANR
jgi:outer membrane protein OmpA-like peptidoglycan-associated protein